MAIDYGRLMNPMWAKWFDRAAAASGTPGYLNLAGGTLPESKEPFYATSLWDRPQYHAQSMAHMPTLGHNLLRGPGPFRPRSGPMRGLKQAAPRHTREDQ